MTTTARTIWAISQAENRTLTRGSREAVTFARNLADQIGGTVVGVALGAAGATGSSELANLDVLRVLEIEDPSLSSYTPAPWIDALAKAFAAAASQGQQPGFLIFPHSYRTVDFLGRLALRLGGALVPEAVACSMVDGELRWRRPIMEGKLQAEVRVRPGTELVLASVQGGACQAAEKTAEPASIERLELPPLSPPDRRIEGVEETGGDGVDLSSAQVVVAVGRGVGEPDKLGPVRELARALGGELGASRPVVDSGWLDRELQIGSSGQTVAPKLYLALGISGAIQHLVGMRGAQCVVAINKDASAPMFRLARYGVVGDLHELVPAITAALAKAV